MPTVAFYTLGCKLNQYETEAIREQFERTGYQVVPFEAWADVYVVNTCSVTSKSDRHSRQMIRRAIQTAPEATVVATGCCAQVSPDSLACIPGVDFILGTQEKIHILDFLNQHRGNGKPFIAISPRESLTRFEEIDISSFGRYTRAFIKIQDGCDRFCSYCIVPFARGPNRSRKLTSVVSQAQRLVDLGYQEIVLTGVQLGAYGQDLEEKISLVDVLQALEKIEGLRRIRLSSIEPTDVSPELIHLLAGSNKICRHLHLPLQGGDNQILARMNRPYRTVDYQDLVLTLVEKVPGIGIGADVMVGFPGEQEKSFRRSYEFIESLPLYYLHVFSYSQRPGTVAATLPDQVPPKVKKERAHRMKELREQKILRFWQSFVGQRLEVLLENRRHRETGKLTGLTDNYIRVLVDGEDCLMSRMVEVEICRVEGDKVFGRICRIERG